jgi:hypothetical protein
MFRGVEQLMGSTVAAQDLLLRSPASFGCGIERLATNLRALQQLYGCSEQQAQRVLLRTPHLTPLKLEAPKFQCRVAALTEWYGHASPGGCAGQTLNQSFMTLAACLCLFNSCCVTPALSTQRCLCLMYSVDAAVSRLRHSADVEHVEAWCAHGVHPLPKAGASRA